MKKLLALVLVLILSTTLPLTVMAEKADQTPRQNMDLLKQRQPEVESIYMGISLIIDEPKGVSEGGSKGIAGVSTKNKGKSMDDKPISGIVNHLAQIYEEERSYGTNGNTLISSQAKIEIRNSGDAKIDSIECFQITNFNTDRYNTSTKAVPCTFTTTGSGYQIKSSDLDMWKEFDTYKGNSDYIGIIIIRVMYEGNSIDEYAMEFMPGTDSEVWTFYEKNRGQGGSISPK